MNMNFLEKKYLEDLVNVSSNLINIWLNPLPDMPNLGSSNSAADKDMMSKMWTNGDTIF